MKKLTVGSLFAGIGGFDLGLERAGMEVKWQVEIEPFCQRVLRRSFDAILHNDVTALPDELPYVDLMCGGFPCQDVSIAGRRAGLSGERSGLFFSFAALAARLNPDWVVIENVPGLLSQSDGRDFAIVLRTLDELGFVGGWTVLDSQFFGLAQRRDRVFIVGHSRASRASAAAVLFDAESWSGGTAPSTQARAETAAATLRGRSSRAGVNAPRRGGEDDANLVAYALRRDPGGIGQAHNTNFVAAPITASEGRTYAHAGNNPGGLHNVVAACLNSGGNSGGFRTEPGEHLVAHALTQSMHKRHDEDTDTLVAIGVHANQRGELRTSDKAGCLSASRSGKQFEGVAAPITASAGHHGHSSPRGDGNDNLVGTRYAIRRLTPLECERLQGFPDGWTCFCGKGHLGSHLCKCDDTPRYKALGNAVSPPVAEWIGRRILEAEAEQASA